MIEGKVAVVTGSTSGIGLGIARSYAKAGASVVINGFGDPARIEETRASLEHEFGRECHYSDADMSKPDAIAAMVAKAEARFGSVDILVNNAGVPIRGAGRGVPGREVGPDPRDQSLVRVPHDPRRRPWHEAARLGPHRQHRLGSRPCRVALQGPPTSPPSTGLPG